MMSSTPSDSAKRKPTPAYPTSEVLPRQLSAASVGSKDRSDCSSMKGSTPHRQSEPSAPPFCAPTTPPVGTTPVLAPSMAPAAHGAAAGRGGGWNPQQDHRFRVALCRHFPALTSSAFADALPEDMTDDAVMAAQATKTPTNDALCNVCTDEEPHVEFVAESTMVNAINSAYTSSGYPSVISTGNARGSIYGSFVDLTNPSLSTLNLPPAATITIAPSQRNGGGRLPAMETLLQVSWTRGTVFAPPRSDRNGSTIRNTSGGGASPGGKGGKRATTSLQVHLGQFPEGVHGSQASPHLKEWIVNGNFSPALPSEPFAAASVDAAARSSTDSGNTPPLMRPPVGSAPVQHTLVSASTFNHLSVYLVAHQDSVHVFGAPVLTLSVSIASRKVTAHCLFMIGKEPLVTPPTGKGSLSRSAVPFHSVPVSEDDANLFFNSTDTTFHDADSKAKTISVATVDLIVEPMLIFGNQNGDLFIFSILEKKIAQRLNYNGGSSQLTGTSVHFSGSNSASKLIASPVSTIVEVQNGVEKRLASMISSAAAAKRIKASSFPLCETATVAEGDCEAESAAYYCVAPTLFAVGFDNGQILLLCVTSEGAWVLKHFGNHIFGSHPIKSIAVRIPPFDVRLWTYYTPVSSTDQPSPRTALVTSDATLLVEEDQHIAAISCNGGSIVLVRLPGLEILSHISVYEYNAVGDILSLCWTANCPSALLTPDILISSGEDDSMTVFKLLNTAGLICSGSGTNYGDSHTLSSSNESILLGVSGLQVLEKKSYHRSWVNHLAVVPIALSSSRTGVGMPQYLGTCIAATSYDSCISFWPILFSSAEISSGEERESQPAYVLIDGPTAAYSLHQELVVSAAVGGGGTSFFMVTVCCRGKVKLWSVKVRQGEPPGVTSKPAH